MQIKKLFIALGIVLPRPMQGQKILIKESRKESSGSALNSIVKIMNCINKISLTVVHLIF